MKRIKIILLLVILLMTTGCSVNYNIYIGDKEIKESFTISVSETEDMSKSTIFTNYKDEYPIYSDQQFAYYEPYTQIDGYTYYNKNYKEYIDGYVFNYNSEANIEDLLRLRTIDMAFKSKISGFNREDNYYYIAFNEPILFNNYNKLNSVDVNISFSDKYEIIYNNADSYNNGVYYWNVNNYSFNGILIKYRFRNDSKESETITKKKTQEDNEYQQYFWPIMGISLLLLVIVILVGVKINSRKR